MSNNYNKTNVIFVVMGYNFNSKMRYIISAHRTATEARAAQENYTMQAIKCNTNKTYYIVPTTLED